MTMKVLSSFFFLIVTSLVTRAQVFIPFSNWGCKTDISYSDSLSTDFTAGTLTNVSWNGSGITLTAGNSSGSFTSRVIDTNNPCVTEFQRLSWISNLPAGKELSMSAESGYGTTPTNFSTSLVGYWRLNEASATVGSSNDFTDGSGQANHGEMAGTLSFDQTGKLNKAIRLNGGATNYIDISDSATLDSTLR